MKITPLRRQYLRVKQKYPEAIVFFRLGDFYETFDEDARIASRVLDIVLTSREMGKGQKVPLAGIPYHAVDNYLARLINQGYKVAICEQLTPPGKGLVERDVIRVVTPGTVVEANLLDSKSNNYLVSLIAEGEKAGIACVDISTSEFAVTQLHGEDIFCELERLKPRELLVPEEAQGFELPDSLSTSLTKLDEYYFDLEVARDTLLEHFGVAMLEGYGCAHLPLAIRAAGALVYYVKKTQKEALSQLNSLRTYSTDSFMILDGQTTRNLELLSGGRWGESNNSLLTTLDVTRTAMGGRLLKAWLGQPLIDIEAIQQRQEAVAWFHSNSMIRSKVGSVLKDIADLERIINRVRNGRVLPRELITLRSGLEKVPELSDCLAEASLEWLQRELKPCQDAITLIATAIAEEPETLEKGGVIKAGFSTELDDVRSKSRDARRYLTEVEQREKQRTKIKSLKVGYNRVFGYYIEVSRAHLNLVPSDYIRKQTLADAERFYTPELKEYESLILNAQEKIVDLETAIFQQVCQQLSAAAERILAIARTVAQIDILCSFAEVATDYNYIKPIMTRDNVLEIKKGRHPIVERSIGCDKFIPNDTHLDDNDKQIIILTGPNMSGKSTYLRQVALIVFMAQIGSYVPAEAATIGITDRIFTRIGAQEDLAAGQSTFMVEMTETANILHNATPRSLVILDEIGRGTSTYDGLSIAWAVTEFIHNSPALGAKTLFATHYHELVELADTLPRVKNFNVAVVEEKGKVIFLHKIVPGGADRSYGVHVAKLAGLPRAVINRAREVLNGLEEHHGIDKPSPVRLSKRVQGKQLQLLPVESPLVEELRKIEVDSLSPLEAITKLYELKRIVNIDGQGKRQAK
jgi:DNA mismatch repair protein MutS